MSRVILATGYQFNLRRYGFLRELITQYRIPLVRGLPRLDDDLHASSESRTSSAPAPIAQLQIGTRLQATLLARVSLMNALRDKIAFTSVKMVRHFLFRMLKSTAVNFCQRGRNASIKKLSRSPNILLRFPFKKTCPSLIPEYL